MILKKTLDALKTGGFKTLPELAGHLKITTEELKSIIDILVATGKLRKKEQQISGSTGCSGCCCSRSCSGCSCHNSNSKASSVESTSKNSILFYEIAENP